SAPAARGGRVSLSVKVSGPAGGSSATTPLLKASRMPCFTQASTRQPAGSGTAARTSPASSADRRSATTRRPAGASPGGPPAAKRATASASAALIGRGLVRAAWTSCQQPEAAETGLQRRPLAGRQGPQRGSQRLAAQAHPGHGGLDRDGVGLDEVQLH